MLKFACTLQELSCIIGNLFVELEPPCCFCEDKEQITICGTTYTGQKAALFIRKGGFYFNGNAEDIHGIRAKRCNSGEKQK